MIQPKQDTLQSAKKIQNYIFRFEDKIGSGCFSEVFKGRDIITNTQKAIKRINFQRMQSKIARRLLQCEINILKIIDHPNLIKCVDVQSSVNNCYIITQYCQQGDLEKLLKLRHQVPENEIAKIILDVYLGLEYLADRKIVHRDLKISNVLSSNGVYKIADFGFSIKANELFEDTAIGSPIYMSPEGLIHNIYGPKTDVWSFGILIYELLHGTTPLATCKSEEELKKNILVAPKISKNVSEDLKSMMLKCLKVNEKERYSIKQIGQTPYMKMLFKKYSSKMQSESKDLTITYYSTQTSLSSDSKYQFLPPINYDTAVSLIHYCRFLHKACKLRSPSPLLSNYLKFLSTELVKAEIIMNNINKEKQKNLWEIIKEYHEKYIKEHGQEVRGVNFEEVIHECTKMGKEGQQAETFQLLAQETEMLRRLLSKNELQKYSLKSKAKQFTNTIFRQLQL